jgi:hypothetical protein
VAGRVGAGGFAVVGDGGHQLAGAAEPVEGGAQAGEVVRERFEEPAGAGADDDLAVGLLMARSVAAATLCGRAEKAATGQTTPS